MKKIKTYVIIRTYSIDAPDEESAKVFLETVGESETYLVDEKIFESTGRK